MDGRLLLYSEHYSEFVSRYELTEYLGKGANGVVWKAEEDLTGKKVAVKTLQKFYLSTLGSYLARGEVDTLSALTHLNIVGFHGVYETYSELIIVMEYVDGCNIKEYMERNPEIPEKRIKQICREILNAIKYMHDSGFHHRDIKDENVMINSKGHVKIIDLGFCAPVSAASTEPKNKCGTYANFPPELIEKRELTGIDRRKSDAWAIGYVFYQMLTRTRPAGPWCKISNFEASSTLSPAVRDVLQGLLHKDAASRFSCSEALDQEWLKDDGADEEVSSESADSDDEAVARIPDSNVEGSVESRNVIAHPDTSSTSMYFIELPAGIDAERFDTLDDMLKWVETGKDDEMSERARGSGWKARLSNGWRAFASRFKVCVRTDNTD